MNQIKQKRYISRVVYLVLGLGLFSWLYAATAQEIAVGPEVDPLTAANDPQVVTPLVTLEDIAKSEASGIAWVDVSPRIEIPSNSRWFYDQHYHNIWTAWGYQPLNVQLGEFSGVYAVKLSISAKNQGTLPAGYTSFSIGVFQGNNRITTLSIPASNASFKEGYAEFFISVEGVVDLTLKWENDSYVPPADANIMLGAIRATLLKISYKN